MKRFLICLLACVLLCVVLFRVSKLTGWQAFGEVVDHVNVHENLVALTFDDGPHAPETLQIVEVLGAHHAKATFFCVGEQLEKHGDIAQQVLAAGHQLGNHSYSHHHMVLRSPSFVREEIQRTDALLRLAGVDGRIDFRAPFGKKLLVLPWILAEQGTRDILFDVTPSDYAGLRADQIAEEVLREAKPGSIIVLHDGGGPRAETVKATGLILEQWDARGFRAVTVDELLRHAG